MKTTAMMRALTAAAALTALAHGESIESGSFTMDGSTTYCMGVDAGSTVGALSFDNLLSSNVGRCPVGLTLTLDASEYHPDDLVTAKWSAAVDSSVTSGIFSDAIDSTTGLPGAVTSSALYACVSGTDCATNTAGTTTGADGTSSGAFDADGTKTLETNTWNLADTGDYIILGLVALPSTDSTLGLSAEEYLVFKTISVVSSDTVISSTSGSGSSATGSASSSGSAASSATGSNSTTTESTTASASKSSANGGSSAEEEENVVSSSGGAAGFFASNGMILVGVLVGCCVIGVVAFAFVMRRRKEKRMRANKAFDLNSPSMDGDLDESALDPHHGGPNGGKIDLTYVANISARNTDVSRNPLSDGSSIPVMTAERGSEINDSFSSSSVPAVTPVDDARRLSSEDEYAHKVSYGAASEVQGSVEDRRSDERRSSDMSSLPPPSEVSMSNFGDSVVDESSDRNLESFDWKDSEFSANASRLDSEEHEELKACGFGSIGGFSTVSGFSEPSFSEESSSRGMGFSMDSRPTEDSRNTDFSEAMRPSRLNSEVSVDSYSFRPSRSSADSYASGMSPYSRQSSRVSGMSDMDSDSNYSFKN